MGSIFKRDGKYGIDYRDHLGRRLRRMVAHDKGVAQRLLGEAIDTAEKAKAGLLHADPREARKPLTEHFKAYLAELERRGRDSMYRYNVGKHLENAAYEQDWSCLRDCTGTSVAAYLRTIAAEGKSPKTVNAHRADLSAFFGWCVRTGALAANPCETVAKSAVRKDKTRRALSVPEIQALLKAAPADRALVYQFLVYTGLRRSEAASLLWAHLRLDVANPCVELPPSLTKSGEAEAVPLVPAVAKALRAHRGDAADHEPVFAEIPSMFLFRADLKAAGIPEVDARGRKVVVHSLRHSLATMLAQSKVPPAVAQKILRHRDIRLTLEVYTDEGLLSTGEAMSALPALAG